MVHEGIVYVLSKNGAKIKEEAHMVFFNDIFLLSSRSSKMLKKAKIFELWELDQLIINDFNEEGEFKR